MDDLANSTDQCRKHLEYVKANFNLTTDFTGLRIISSTYNIERVDNPYVSVTVERPLKMSTNKYGHENISMDFAYDQKYQLMMNFQKNTTNMAFEADALTKIQIANDSLAVINTTGNKTYRDELWQYYLWLTRLRN